MDQSSTYNRSSPPSKLVRMPLQNRSIDDILSQDIGPLSLQIPHIPEPLPSPQALREIIDTHYEKSIEPLRAAFDELCRRRQLLLFLEPLPKDTLLAFKIVDHDVIGIVGTMNNAVIHARRYKQGMLDPEFPENQMTRFIRSVDVLRYLGLSMLSLASQGNPQYDVPISLSRIPSLLSIGPNIHPPSSCTTQSSLSAIDLPVWFALYQVAKNARGNYEITIDHDDASLKIAVSDTGPGLVTASNIPMTKENIPTIFGDYSSRRGGGLGLKLVKRFTEILSGNVEVVSRAKNAEGSSITMRYNTNEKDAQTLSDSKLETGCTFTLTVPKTRLYFL